MLFRSFYLFGVRRVSTCEWLAWDEVTALAQALELPHAPVWWRGTLKDPSQLKALLRRAGAAPSALSSCAGEGFVVRLAASFRDDAFERSVAKYVRANHVQTAPDFRRSWRKAAIGDGVQHAGWCSPLDEPTASVARDREAQGTGLGRARARCKGGGKPATTVGGGGGGGGGEGDVQPLHWRTSWSCLEMVSA